MGAEAAVEVLVAAGALGEPGWDGTQPKNPAALPAAFSAATSLVAPRDSSTALRPLYRLRSAQNDFGE